MYIRQWYEFAADRLPLLQNTAAAAATEHGRDLSRAEVTQIFNSEFQEAQRKGGVTHGVSGLSATEQEARTAIRNTKYNIWKAKCLDKEYRAGTRSSFVNWEQRLLHAYWQGSLQQRLLELKSQYQGDPMHRSPLPP